MWKEGGQKLWCDHRPHPNNALLSCLELFLGRTLYVHVCVHTCVYIHKCSDMIHLAILCHASVSGPRIPHLEHAFGNFQTFNILSSSRLVCILHAQSDTWIFNNKNSILRESIINWHNILADPQWIIPWDHAYNNSSPLQWPSSMLSNPAHASRY